MSDKQVEHHWHDPTQGQVTKAMLQHFNDLGVTREELFKIVDKKIEEVVYKRVGEILGTPEFDTRLIAAVAHVLLGDKQPYEKNGYGYHNRIRDLVTTKIKEVIVADYEISIKPRAKEKA